MERHLEAGISFSLSLCLFAVRHKLSWDSTAAMHRVENQILARPLAFLSHEQELTMVPEPCLRAVTAIEAPQQFLWVHEES